MNAPLSFGAPSTDRDAALRALQLDCRRLFLRDHEVRMSIGAFDREKTALQRVVINIELYVPYAESTPKADRLAEVVDYGFMRDTVAARLAEGHVHLQETLCDDLLARLLAHPKVRAASVRTEKIEAYADCRSVGCEVFAMRPTP